MPTQKGLLSLLLKHKSPVCSKISISPTEQRRLESLQKPLGTRSDITFKPAISPLCLHCLIQEKKKAAYCSTSNPFFHWKQQCKLVKLKPSEIFIAFESSAL